MVVGLLCTQLLLQNLLVSGGGLGNGTHRHGRVQLLPKQLLLHFKLLRGSRAGKVNIWPARAKLLLSQGLAAQLACKRHHRQAVAVANLDRLVVRRVHEYLASSRLSAQAALQGLGCAAWLKDSGSTYLAAIS